MHLLEGGFGEGGGQALKSCTKATLRSNHPVLSCMVCYLELLRGGSNENYGYLTLNIHWKD